MRKLDRYIIRKFLGTFFLAIALIIVVVVVFDISEKIDKFIEKGAPLHAVIFDYYVNFIPYFINMFSSLFIFISVIYFTTRMAQNSEIIPVLCSGISYRRLMVPYIICALFIGCLNLILANWVIPDVNKTRLEFERTYVKSAYYNTNTNIHLQYDSNTYYYVESFDNRSNTGNRFSLEKIEGQRMLEKITAQTIRFDTARQMWRLLDYTRRTLNDGGGEIFEHGNFMEMEMALRPMDFAADFVRVEELNHRELNEALSVERQRGGTRVSYFEFERIQRFLHPLATLIMTLMGLCLSSRKKRGGMGSNLAIGIALAFTFILFLQMSRAFAVSGSTSVWFAAFLPIMIYGLVTAGLIRLAQK